VLVLQVQRLAAMEELEETCRRVREYCGGCRIIIVASAATGMFVEHLGCAEDVLRITRWSGRRMRALVRRALRRGVTDTCIVYDSTAAPGPARLELLALAMRTPLYYRQLGGAVRPLSRGRLWARFIAGIALAGLAAGFGALAGAAAGAGLVITQALLATRRGRAHRRRHRIQDWNEEWLRRL